MDDLAPINEYLKKSGADVRPGSEMPSDIRDEIEARAKDMPDRKPGVEIKRLEENQYYTYDDDELTFTVAIPNIPIFMAFVEEMQQLDEGQSINGYFSIIARAFWLLHQKPLFGPKVPKVKTRTALKFLAAKIPQADYVMPSLSQALLGLIGYVVGKKKVEGTPDSVESEKPSPE